MSKVVDPENMSKFDRRYLQDRGIDPDEYAARFRLVEEPDDDEEDDGPVLVEQPQEGQEPGRLNQAEDTDIPPYEEWNVKALRNEIKNRNETRDEDSKIEPASSNKPDLIAALEADDELDNDSDDEDES